MLNELIVGRNGEKSEQIEDLVFNLIQTVEDRISLYAQFFSRLNDPATARAIYTAFTNGDTHYITAVTGIRNIKQIATPLSTDERRQLLDHIISVTRSHFLSPLHFKKLNLNELTPATLDYIFFTVVCFVANRFRDVSEALLDGYFPETSEELKGLICDFLKEIGIVDPVNAPYIDELVEYIINYYGIEFTGDIAPYFGEELMEVDGVVAEINNTQGLTPAENPDPTAEEVVAIPTSAVIDQELLQSTKLEVPVEEQQNQLKEIDWSKLKYKKTFTLVDEALANRMESLTLDPFDISSKEFAHIRAEIERTILMFYTYLPNEDVLDRLTRNFMRSWSIFDEEPVVSAQDPKEGTSEVISDLEAVSVMSEGPEVLEPVEEITEEFVAIEDESILTPIEQIERHSEEIKALVRESLKNLTKQATKQPDDSIIGQILIDAVRLYFKGNNKVLDFIPTGDKGKIARKTVKEKIVDSNFRAEIVQRINEVKSAVEA